VTPFNDAIRAAGTMHLGATNANLSQRKIAAIASAARASFTGWPVTDRDLAVSFGLRPVSPDGLPVIGRIEDVDNLFVAGGHAMLGVTLAPVTAFELANLIESGHPSAAIEPLAPGRFA
jgi:D-amino-acid dehydrogenase